MYVLSLAWLFCTFFLIRWILSSGALYSEFWHTEMGLSIQSILSLIIIRVSYIPLYSYCHRNLLYHTLSLCLYYIFPSKFTLCKHQLNQTSGLLAVLLE